MRESYIFEIDNIFNMPTGHTTFVGKFTQTAPERLNGEYELYVDETKHGVIKVWEWMGVRKGCRSIAVNRTFNQVDENLKGKTLCIKTIEKAENDRH